MILIYLVVLNGHGIMQNKAISEASFLNRYFTILLSYRSLWLKLLQYFKKKAEAIYHYQSCIKS
jgi:hypothetical protein